jgi:hypothetical protein
LNTRLSEASAWHKEMFDPEPNAADPTSERQAQFHAWLLEPRNHEALGSVTRISDGLEKLFTMSAREARELLGDDYEPILECFSGGKATE